jgi:hypothetical protein
MKLKRSAAPTLLLSLVAAVELGACSGGASSGRTSGGAGTTGAAGAAAGAAGAAGATGGAGTTGDAGATGSAGITGGAGTTTGEAGTTGAAGATGAAGTPAVDGSADTGTGSDVTPLSGTVKLMVLGSSNERGTCWRAYLQRDLMMNNITNFDFVGEQNIGPSCTGVTTYDKDVQAPQDGIIITGLPASTYAGWFKANTPQIALMHFGGADLLANMPVDGVMAAYTTLLGELRKANPNAVLLIAQHTPEGKDAVLTLNADIAKWATQNTTPQSPVIAVDLYTGILPSDQSDGVHLNLSGSQKVADRFLAALKPFFKP